MISVSWLRKRAETPAQSFQRLSMLLRDSGLPYVRDAVIPDQVGGYTQIDHLLLTPAGIVLMEMHYFRGQLHGSAHTQRWIRFDRGQRHEFDNPLRSLRPMQSTLEQIILADKVHVRVHALLIATGPVRFTHGVPDNVLTEPMFKPWLMQQAGPMSTRLQAVWNVLLSRVVFVPVAPYGGGAVRPMMPSASDV